jgi:membrane protein YdbS with pleckstrin-like domain
MGTSRFVAMCGSVATWRSPSRTFGHSVARTVSDALPDPQQRLPEAAVGLWRLVLGLWCVGGLVVSMALAPVADEIGVPIWLAPVLVVVLGVAAVVVIPRVRWRRWRYEVREDEIDLRAGLWTIRRTLVPIRRVQHVDTESSLLQTFYDLATVRFYTAAGATEIPALRRDEAERVRSRIAELARTRDDV